MTGIEFSIEHEQPPIWIIKKQFRTGPAPDATNIIATYYISGATVYQAPAVYYVIDNRLVFI